MAKDVTQFAQYLRNLQSTNVKQVTLDVDFLIDLLNIPSAIPVEKKEKPSNKMNVDGGEFGDD
jgi:hypothetical protein